MVVKWMQQCDQLRNCCCATATATVAITTATDDNEGENCTRAVFLDRTLAIISSAAKVSQVQNQQFLQKTCTCSGIRNRKLRNNNHLCDRKLIVALNAGSQLPTWQPTHSHLRCVVQMCRQKGRCRRQVASTG